MLDGDSSHLQDTKVGPYGASKGQRT